jgi:hypothetical protein
VTGYFAKTLVEPERIDDGSKMSKNKKNRSYSETRLQMRDLGGQREVKPVDPWGSPKTGQLGSPQNRPVETVI